MRIFSLFIAFMLTFNIFTEEVLIGGYHDNNGDGEHNVIARLKENGSKIDCIYIFVASTMGNGYYRIDSNKIPEFVTALSEVKTKFEEWSTQAIDNGIEKFTKQISVNFPKVVVYLSGKSNFNFSQKLNALFQVDNGIPCVWIYASTSTNFSKYNNKKEVFSMLFENPSDIDGLISILRDEETILQLAHKNLQIERKFDDLFQ